MYQLLSYLKFLWRSSNQHGIHSPFIYTLVTQCFYDKKTYPSYDLINRFRNSNLGNTGIIEVRDFGAGSRVFKSSERKISDIARNAGITRSRAKLLNRMVRYLGINSALELGTSLGIGSAAITAGNKVALTTFEGCPNTAKMAEKNFTQFGLDTINIETGSFNKLLQSPLPKPAYDLIYFDGNHKKLPTLEYFNLLLPYAHNNSIFIFDDIHWSREMTEAWEEIRTHPSVKVSIDTFFWGIVFFRKEQEKEHFNIRI